MGDRQVIKISSFMSTYFRRMHGYHESHPEDSISAQRQSRSQPSQTTLPSSLIQPRMLERVVMVSYISALHRQCQRNFSF